MVVIACSSGPGGGVSDGESTGQLGNEAAAAAVLEAAVARVDSIARGVDSIFRPLSLLTPSQEGALRAYGNAQQLERARRFGIGRGAADDALAALQREGRLVPLVDSEYWVVAELDHSQPLVVPGVVALLTDIGERFQARLADLGSPFFRFEVSSVLRSASDQEALRAVNPNAALGESTHEYGTTVDVLYSAFAVPARPLAEVAGEGWAEGFVERYAEVAAERVAARRAMELKAILGDVLLEVQAEGRVMVTLERQQPVFHMTLAGAP
jgi:hypothetical protein